MDFYENKGKYYAIPYFMKLDNAVNEMNKNGALRVIDPPFKMVSTFNEKQLVKFCRERFFSTLEQPNFTILSLHLINDEDPFYFRSAKVTVLSSLHHAIHMLTIAIDEVSKFSENVEFYLKVILRDQR